MPLRAIRNSSHRLRAGATAAAASRACAASKALIPCSMMTPRSSIPCSTSRRREAGRRAAASARLPPSPAPGEAAPARRATTCAASCRAPHRAASEGSCPRPDNTPGRVAEAARAGRGADGGNSGGICCMAKTCHADVAKGLSPHERRGANSRWQGRSPSARRPSDAPVAQLDRALPSEDRGQRFESSRVRHLPLSGLMPNRPRSAWRLAAPAGRERSCRIFPGRCGGPP